MEIIYLIQSFFTKGDQRSLEAKKNTMASFVVKGVSISVGLVFVPLTIIFSNTHCNLDTHFK